MIVWNKYTVSCKTFENLSKANIMQNRELYTILINYQIYEFIWFYNCAYLNTLFEYTQLNYEFILILIYFSINRFLPGFAPFVDGTVIVNPATMGTSPLTLPAGSAVAR